VVLDIGSGAGIDCLIAAEKVGAEGKVIGLDMTPAMLERARANAREAGADNVEFRKGEADDMPVENDSVDWVISNCVINLAPDKGKVFGEVARILKPGGRVSISDIVLGDDLPEEVVKSVDALVGCVAGAIKEADYLEEMRMAGLVDVEVTERMVYGAKEIEGLLGECCVPASEEEEEEAGCCGSGKREESAGEGCCGGGESAESSCRCAESKDGAGCRCSESEDGSSCCCADGEEDGSSCCCADGEGESGCCDSESSAASGCCGLEENGADPEISAECIEQVAGKIWSARIVGKKP